ncbi:X-ray repair cross-complementing protein 5 [Boothiomyces sp. JEL0866]|nr:X-ray repair cross-complementing protein 5 [Boothiomyces sp. JEL0866]
MFTRHGARFPTAKSFQAHLDIANLVQSSALFNNEPIDLQYGNSSNAGLLHPTGKKSVFEYGQRFQSRYSQTNLLTDHNKFFSSSSNDKRVLQTASNFFNGMTGSDLPNGAVKNRTLDADNDMNKSCFLYVNTPKNKQESKAFEKSIRGELTSRVNSKLQLNLNDTQVSTLQDACAFQLAYGSSLDKSVCKPFDEQDFVDFALNDDLSKFYTLSYGLDAPFNSQFGCSPLVGLVANIKSQALSATFHFGHAETIIPIVTSLGLFKDQQPLTANDTCLAGRQFQVTKIAPFQTNLVFEIYAGESPSNPDIRLLMNEIPLALPCSRNGLVSLQEFESHYKDVLSCKFDSICQNPYTSIGGSNGNTGNVTVSTDIPSIPTVQLPNPTFPTPTVDIPPVFSNIPTVIPNIPTPPANIPTPPANIPTNIPTPPANIPTNIPGASSVATTQSVVSSAEISLNQNSYLKMSKEATVFIVDVGPSMPKRDIAVQIVSKLLTNKMQSNRKGDQVGVLLVGSETCNRVNQDDEGYENILEVNFKLEDTVILSPANIKMVQLMQRAKPSADGDIMDALIVAVQLIAKHTVSEKTGKPLKYDKKIYIFTNGKSPIDQDGAELVISKLDEEQIKLSLCGFEFDENNDNQSFLMQMILNLGVYFESQDALDLINQQATKQVKPTTTFRGSLVLGDPENITTSLKIPIWMYNKTSKLTLPTAKKLSKPGLELGDGKVEVISTLKTVKGETDEKVERIKAFRYGKHLVPYTEQDEQTAQLETLKSLAIITFVPKEKIKREYYMGNVLAVIKDPTSNSVQLDSIVEACKLNNVVGIARYVRTDKAAVKMCALIPNRKGYFYMIQLPYQNDIYHFNFSTLPTPKPDAAIDAALDKFINSNEQSLMPKEVYNPVYQNMVDAIVNRAMDNPIPSIKPFFNQKLDDSLLFSLFEITRVLEKPKGKIKSKNTTVHVELDDLDALWSDEENDTVLDKPSVLDDWETVKSEEWKSKEIKKEQVNDEQDDFVLLQAQKVLGKRNDDFVLVDKQVKKEPDVDLIDDLFF